MGREDTIAAIATGLTDSGIGIIRISGSEAVKVGDGMFRSPSGKRILSHGDSHVLYYGYVNDMERDIAVDEVMAVVMRAPRSFTGEDTVEIQCHGGVLVMQRILGLALKCGARLAQPGEFTKRAFLNGRMDLSRAEAVMDVISSQNEYALAASVRQLKGALWENVKAFREEIIHEVAHIEAALDDPEHISMEGYAGELEERLAAMSGKIRMLIESAEDGRLIKEGINTVIIGKPNAGKSSLLNRLVGEERAIVTEVAGTTRDVLEETVRLGDISLNIVDTAGIRDTEDVVERIGVERAKKYAGNADLLIYVADASADLDENDRKIISIAEDKNIVVLLNKSDLESVTSEDGIRQLFRQVLPERFADMSGPAVVKTCAHTGMGLEAFQETVREMFFHGKLNTSGEIVITNLRHREALQEALDSLCLVRESIGKGLPEDFYSIDLMNAYSSLGRIIGEEVDDDLVEEIFSKFCMGK